MQSANDQLKDFHNKASIKRTGSLPAKFKFMTLEERVAVLELRQKLIAEEYDEVIEALDEFEDSVVGIYNSKTKEHLAKELADLCYVIIGTAVDLGINLPLAFDLVHENNLLKLANCTVRDDGKLVKAADHPQVDLSGCV